MQQQQAPERKREKKRRTEKTEENQREKGRTGLFTTYPNSSLCSRNFRGTELGGGLTSRIVTT